MKKNIWIINHYATNMYNNNGGRHYWFAKELLTKGYKPIIICANTLHNTNKKIYSDDQKYFIEEKEGIVFVFIKTVISQKNDLTRLKNMYYFYRNLMSVYKEIMKSVCIPNIIYASSVHPLSLVAGIKISKKLKISCISEIRDLWPESIFKFTQVKEKSMIGYLLVKGEYWIYRKSDSLIFTKEGDTDYIREKKWFTDQGGKIDEDKCFYINNGVNIKEFNSNVIKNTFYDEDLYNDKFKVVYSGAIRPVNDIRKLIRIAEKLKNDSRIHFLVYGTGPELENMKQYIKRNQIKNITFKGQIEKEKIPYILNKCDLCILNYSQNLYNWTRGNSSNKLFEYFTSGKPVISTVKMGYSPIKKYKCGFEFAGDNNEMEVANKISEIADIYFNDFGEYEKLCKNSLLASADFDISILTDKLIRIIESVD